VAKFLADQDQRVPAGNPKGDQEGPLKS
jgi:hypothetical protein